MLKAIKIMIYAVILSTGASHLCASGLNDLCNDYEVQRNVYAAKFFSELLAIETMAAPSETGVRINALSQLLSELINLGVIGATTKIQFYDKAFDGKELKYNLVANTDELSNEFNIAHVAGSNLLIAAAWNTLHNLSKTYQKFKKSATIAEYHQDEKVNHYLQGKKRGQRLWLLANYIPPLIAYFNYLWKHNTDPKLTKYSSDEKKTSNLIFAGTVILAYLSEMMRTRTRYRLETATPKDPLSVPTHVVHTQEEVE